MAIVGPLAARFVEPLVKGVLPSAGMTAKITPAA
jgi:hypothetical protein